MIFLEIFVDVIDYVLYYWLFTFHFEKKRKVKQPVLILAAVGAGVLEYRLYRMEQQLAVILFSLFLILAGSLSLFHGRRRWRLLFAVIAVFFSVTAENVTGMIVAVVLHIPVTGMISWPGAALLAKMIYLSVKALFIYLYGYRRNEKRVMLETGFLAPETMLIPVVSFIGTITYGYFSLMQDEPEYLMTLGVWLFMALINGIYFVVLMRHARLHRENMTNQMKRQELEMKEEYYRGVERYQDEIRRIRHDLNNQLLMIGAAFDEGNQNAAGVQVEMIRKELQAGEIRNYTRHSGLNMLLNAKREAAEKEAILCDFSIKVPGNTGFEERNLGVVTGNLLDNAIEACCRCEGRRYIQLKMIYYKNSLVIRMENSSDGQVTGLNTRKTDQRNHGIGSESIGSIVAKYNGDVAYEMNGNVFIAEVSMWEGKCAADHELL